MNNNSALEKLRKLNNVSVSDKLSVVLVYQGTMEANQLEIMYRYIVNGENLENNAEKDIVLLMEILQELNIPYHTRMVYYKENPLKNLPGERNVQFFYGKEKDRLESLYLHTSEESDHVYYRMIAVPETAMEAIKKRTTISHKIEQKEFYITPFYVLKWFPLSQTHHDEELAHIEKYVDQALTITPWLWDVATELLNLSHLQ